jgi:hypothetical protein
VFVGVGLVALRARVVATRLGGRLARLMPVVAAGITVLGAVLTVNSVTQL